MAPTAPSKRRSLRSKLAAKTSEPHVPRPRRPDTAEISDEFINSKKDKRLIKHASFVSRIEKTNKKPLKRRRPGKKLVTDLDSLKKALPGLLDDGETEEGLQQLKDGKLRLKSLKSRKGALKRKEKLLDSEVKRFGVSLAQLNAVGAASPAQGTADVPKEASGAEGNSSQQSQNTTAPRWAALRGFISSTMEQNPAFMDKKEVRK